PGFPRMLCIRVGRFQRPGQKHTRCKIGCFLQATVGNCFLSALSNFRKRGSREIISLVGDEPPMTACGGSFIGGEISRNKQSPKELRRLRLRNWGG
ncbi:MAG: hypothetical protein IJQ33_09325, partial [Clostridia bacterium]|nr:hypothetical protein [Clostridia bacterium]